MSRLPRSLARLAPLVALVSTACASGPTRRAASVVQYLYPTREAPTVSVASPVLKLPLSVGVAFVPDEGASARGDAVPEAVRVEVLRRVADRFGARPFVRRIDVIPTSYLTPRGGFANLEQLAAMFGVDVVVLVSYDQVQFESDGKLSFTYLTVAGAYLVSGQKNETRTMVDAAVFDVASRRLLFRAPGVSSVRTSATPVDAERAQRRDAESGLRQAVDDMIKQLDVALAQFADRAKAAPGEIRIVRDSSAIARGASSDRSVPQR